MDGCHQLVLLHSLVHVHIQAVVDGCLEALEHGG
jgi:hypothetical protein